MVGILVTGGMGFIGHKTIKELLKCGYEIFSIDNFSTNVVNEIKGVKNYRSNLLDYKLLKEITKNVKYVFHFAAQTKVPISLNRPFHDFKVNVQSTLNLIEACRVNDVERIIFSSTAAVYGNFGKEGIKEYDVKCPINPYGVSKLAAENYLRIYYEIYGLETIILRYFNVYGLEKTNNVIGIFKSKVQRNEQIVIYGDGNQQRDFIYINDVINANLLAIKKGHPGEAYNIGTGKSTTINELKNLILQVSKKQLKTKYHPMRMGETRGSVADISKSTKELAYTPQYSLKEGLIDILKAK